MSGCKVSFQLGMQGQGKSFARYAVVRALSPHSLPANPSASATATATATAITSYMKSFQRCKASE